MTGWRLEYSGGSVDNYYIYLSPRDPDYRLPVITLEHAKQSVAMPTFISSFRQICETSWRLVPAVAAVVFKAPIIA